MSALQPVLQLLRTRWGIPVHVERDDNCVDDIRPPADEEHPIFLVGLCQRLAHPRQRGSRGCHLDQSQVAHTLVLRVIADGGDCPLCGRGQLCVAVVNTPNSNSGDEVPAILHGVEDRHWFSAAVVEHSREALDHWSPVGLLVVSEASLTALEFARFMQVAA